jgi:hypothetical protein
VAKARRKNLTTQYGGRLLLCEVAYKSSRLFKAQLSSIQLLEVPRVKGFDIILKAAVKEVSHGLALVKQLY